jgi:hypothetical protein
MAAVAAPARRWPERVLGRASVAAAIPGCRGRFYPGEGHLHFVRRLPEILRDLGPTP